MLTRLDCIHLVFSLCQGIQAHSCLVRISFFIDSVYLIRNCSSTQDSLTHCFEQYETVETLATKVFHNFGQLSNCDFALFV